jgi:hypothetical protein
MLIFDVSSYNKKWNTTLLCLQPHAVLCSAQARIKNNSFCTFNTAIETPIGR